MVTPLQKKTAQAIVNIFETGRPLGDYGSVAVIRGDSGHLTYGRSQTTLASGNLALLLHAYCGAGGTLSDSLSPFLSAFDRMDLKLDENEKVKGLLRQAGDDPVMKKIQDDFFDRIYWEPALKSAENLGVSKALGLTVIYDSKIHGSYDRIRNMVDRQRGKLAYVGEEEWIKSYVLTRRNWLSTNSNELLHKTVYRMDSFNALMDDGKWDLPLPLTVRSVVISEELLGGGYDAPVTASAAAGDERVLFYTRPMMRGEDVRRLQDMLGLSGKDADGIFGAATDKAVRDFQKTHGLKVDGKAGPATRAALMGR